MLTWQYREALSNALAVNKLCYVGIYLWKSAFRVTFAYRDFLILTWFDNQARSFT